MAHSPSISYTPTTINLLDLTGQLLKSEPYSFACGEYANIYQADWVAKDSGYAVNVAVKDFKVLKRPMDLDKRIRREIRIRSELAHENIAPLLGVSYDFGRQNLPCLITPYYRNGNIINYLRGHPNVDKPALLKGISAGLSYLHSMSVVHGNVQGSNILINDNYEASLTDFGRSRVLQMSGFNRLSPSGRCTAPEISTTSEEVDLNPATTEEWRWMSPELMTDCLDEEGQCTPRVTTATDVWAFAMTVVEVFTETVPFSHIKSDASVIMYILSGGRPKHERCPQINDEMWELLEMCWDVVPKRRPSMATLCRFFSLQTTPVTAERARL